MFFELSKHVKVGVDEAESFFLNIKEGTLTTNRLSSPSRICFSLRAMASPPLFFTWVLSNFLQAYIIPVARTWQAHTWRQNAT